MALLRVQAAAGLKLALLIAQLPACAETARVVVSVPRPAAAGAEKAMFLAEAAEAGGDLHFRRQVLGGLVKGFLDSGKYSIVPVGHGAGYQGRVSSVFEGITVGDEQGMLSYRRWSAERTGKSFLDAARDLARERGAEVLVVLLGASSSLEERVHHVHRYLDGNARGEAAVVDLEQGTITGLARERVSASARARYATSLVIQDHLASRLAGSLTRGLLYQKRGERVDLEDPRDGSLRRGIELARKGDWSGAAAAWEESLAAGFHPAAGHYNIAVARRILGDLPGSREHLEAAVRLAPGRSLYRRALGETPGGEGR